MYGKWAWLYLADCFKVTYFYQDYAAVSKLCTTVDNQLRKDSVNAAGPNYYTITALAVRQAFGSMQLAANGTGDDYYVFLKEISSDGNIQTVDIIFPLVKEPNYQPL